MNLDPRQGSDQLPPRSVAVIIPCYKAAKSIRGVLAEIGPDVAAIYCVDDASPDNTAAAVTLAMSQDRRIRLVMRSVNGGVGAATMDGYRAAIADGAEVLIKIDSDGQMDPAFIPDFAAPILRGEADYVKGNRFFDVDNVRAMPALRIIGNAGLSFLTKLSTGYWDLFDPANGYTSLHAGVAALLPFDRVHNRYFFESDLLFRLGVVRARVVELPIIARYGEETSHLSELRCLMTFPWLHARNLLKRILYNYFLRNFSIASINLVMGLLLMIFGLAFGVDRWIAAAASNTEASAGTVMLSALPFMLGVQLLLTFLAQDMALTPREPVQGRISRLRALPTPAPAASAPSPAHDMRNRIVSDGTND